MKTCRDCVEIKHRSSNRLTKYLLKSTCLICAAEVNLQLGSYRFSSRLVFNVCQNAFGQNTWSHLDPTFLVVSLVPCMATISLWMDRSSVNVSLFMALYCCWEKCFQFRWKVNTFKYLNLEFQVGEPSSCSRNLLLVNKKSLKNACFNAWPLLG